MTASRSIGMNRKRQAEKASGRVRRDTGTIGALPHTIAQML